MSEDELEKILDRKGADAELARFDDPAIMAAVREGEPMVAVVGLEMAIRTLTEEQWQALVDRLNLCRGCQRIDHADCQCWNDE